MINHSSLCRDAVITTPVFFNQAERMALVAAAQLGGLNVLQLMNTPMAAAVNRELVFVLFPILILSVC